MMIVCVFFRLGFRVNVKSPPLLEDELLVSIGEKYSKSPAQVALRFNVQRGVTVIPKSFSPDRIRHNFQVAFYYTSVCITNLYFIRNS